MYAHASLSSLTLTPVLYRSFLLRSRLSASIPVIAMTCHCPPCAPFLTLCRIRARSPKMLVRNPKDRLGCGPEDAEEIKGHAFFAAISFDDLLAGRIHPQWRPPVAGSLDTSQFDTEFTSMPLVSPGSSRGAGMFAGAGSRGNSLGSLFAHMDADQVRCLRCCFRTRSLGRVSCDRRQTDMYSGLMVLCCLSSSSLALSLSLFLARPRSRSRSICSVPSVFCCELSPVPSFVLHPAPIPPA